MSKFTKGTWKLNKHFDVVSENGQFIALCCIRHKKLGYHYIENIKLYNEETKANARLIAAAPEMYQHLKIILNGEFSSDNVEQLLAQIDGEETKNED